MTKIQTNAFCLAQLAGRVWRLNRVLGLEIGSRPDRLKQGLMASAVSPFCLWVAYGVAFLLVRVGLWPHNSLHLQTTPIPITTSIVSLPPPILPIPTSWHRMSLSFL